MPHDFIKTLGAIAQNNKLHDVADKIANKFANFILQGTDEELITLDVLLTLAKSEREKNSLIKNFMLAIDYDEAFNPGDDNVTLKLAFLDADLKPVIIDDKNSNAYLWRTKSKNIDENILALLNGKKSVTVQM